MVPPPTRQDRLSSDRDLCRLQRRERAAGGALQARHGAAQVGPSLYAGDGMLMAWHHEPIAPWQDERWLAEMRRTLRPNQYLRMIENRFVTSESRASSIWRRGTRASTLARPVVERTGSADLGRRRRLDQARQHRDRRRHLPRDRRVRLVDAPRLRAVAEIEPIDFETAIEATLLDLAPALCDAAGFCSIRGRWRRWRSGCAKRGLPIEEFPQTAANLTEASQNLFELINGRNIMHVSRCRHAPGGLARRRRRDLARLADRQGESEPQDRRRRRARHGRLCRGQEREHAG